MTPMPQDGTILVLGGLGNQFVHNDVWATRNQGRNWTALVIEAPWKERYFHRAVALAVRGDLGGACVASDRAPR